MGKNMFDKRSVFIVTGANRGLGKSFAINFACKAAKSSVIVLLARNIASLKEVEAEINSKCPDLNVICNQYDQADLKKVESTLEKIFRDGNLDKESYEQAVIIHNAGTLGDNGKFARDFDNVEELKSYFNTNLTGVMLLTSAFMKLFPQDRFKQRHIINISSLNAIKAVKSFSLYCTGEIYKLTLFPFWETRNSLTLLSLVILCLLNLGTLSYFNSWQFFYINFGNLMTTFNPF